MKTCRICRLKKPEDKFGWRRKGKERETYCKHCKSTKAKNHYKSYKPRKMELEKAHKKEMRQFLLDYKSQHPCVDCGETNPLVLEFDHVSGNKKYSIATLHGYSLSTIKKEIGKCQIRCASCHAIKTSIDYYKDLVIPEYQDLRRVRAAAPKLLEACGEMLGFLSHIQPKIGEMAFEHIWDTVVEATEKATS